METPNKSVECLQVEDFHVEPVDVQGHRVLYCKPPPESPFSVILPNKNIDKKIPLKMLEKRPHYGVACF